MSLRGFSLKVAHELIRTRHTKTGVEKPNTQKSVIYNHFMESSIENKFDQLVL